MIKELKKYEQNGIKEWFELDEPEQVFFLKKLATYFESNLPILTHYCSSLEIKSDSSLKLVYEAVSVYSFNFNDFILREIKKIVGQAIKGKIKAELIYILTSFNLKNLHRQSYVDYQQIINYLINSLSGKHSDKLNIQILELLDSYLISSNEEDYLSWQQDLNEFKNNASGEIRWYLAKKREVKRVSRVSNKVKYNLLRVFFILVTLYPIIYLVRDHYNIKRIESLPDTIYKEFPVRDKINPTKRYGTCQLVFLIDGERYTVEPTGKDNCEDVSEEVWELFYNKKEKYLHSKNRSKWAFKVMWLALIPFAIAVISAIVYWNKVY